MPPGPARSTGHRPAADTARRLRPVRRGWAGRLLVLNVAGLLAVSVWFRLHLLGNLPGLNGDEAWYGVQAMRLLGGQVFEWATPTGNPLNPLFFGPLVVLHWLFGPSIAVLRAVAVFSGLAALVVNWLLCRRVFGARAAMLSTTILAVLPVAIAYSRFAWDASQTVLVTLPVWYLSLGALGAWHQRRWWLSAAAALLLVAVLVHPANVFAAAAPLAVAATAWHGRRRSGKAAGQTSLAAPGRLTQAWAWIAQRLVRQRATGITARCRIAAIIAATATLAALSIAAAAPGHSTSPAAGGRGAVGLAAWLRPGTLATCAALSARLFTGGTIYQYLSGSASWLQWPAGKVGSGGAALLGLDVLGFWAALGASYWAIGRHVAQRRAARSSAAKPSAAQSSAAQPSATQSSAAQPSADADRALAGGCALGLVGYWLAVGPAGMIPGYERYALWLVVPLVLVIARGMELLGAGSKRAGGLMAAIGVALGWLVLADFYAHYFRFVAETGGRAHRTFCTAAVDPKQAAAELILAQLSTGRASPEHLPAQRPSGHQAVRAERPAEPPCYIVASEWWSQWALRYFTAGKPQLRVLCPADAAAGALPAAAVAEGRVFWVEFAGSQRLGELRSRLAGPRLVQWPVRDYAGRVVLWVVHQQAEAADD